VQKVQDHRALLQSSKRNKKALVLQSENDLCGAIRVEAHKEAARENAIVTMQSRSWPLTLGFQALPK